jgi:hypothetical protein
MVDSSLMPALIGLGGTVIGFTGGFVAQWFLEGKKQAYETQKQIKQQEYEKEKETRRKREEKLEELVVTIYDHREWMHTIQQIVLSNKPEPLANSPFAKIEAIKQVYFPQFDPLVRKVAATSSAYFDMLQGNAVVLQQLDLSPPRQNLWAI